MDVQNPIQDAATTSEQKDESKVSKTHWPWIVGGLCIALVILWNQHIADVKEIKLNANDRIQDSKEVAFAWQQIAQERNDLKVSTSYLVKYTGDTAIRRRIDSAIASKQSR